jgi:geranylgeranyl reductase family protein
LKSYDGMVVGAGPAGCAAAYDLAAAGLTVLLIDRKNFPRVKPCGGALTIKALKRLRYPITPVIRTVGRGADIDVSFAGLRRVHRFAGAEPVCVMTLREELDSYCLAQTLARGVEFQLVPGLRSLSEDEEGVSILATDGSEFRCRYLVGADGATSQVARLSGALAERPEAAAIEGQVRFSDMARRPRVRLDFNEIAGGYGWLFPKDDHVNIGLGSFKVRVNRSLLLAYSRKMLGTDRVERIVGHPLAIGGETYRPRHERIFLVGDAAGMTERMLGEGIHNAIMTGQLAATAIADAIRAGCPSGERFRSLMREVQLDLESCASGAAWLYRFPFLGFGVLRFAGVRRMLMRATAAGMTFRDTLRAPLSSGSYVIEPVACITEFEAASPPSA